MKQPDEKTHAAEMLQELAPQGTTVYCVLRSVPKSGMSRRIDFYVVDPADSRILCITGYIQTLFGRSHGRSVDKPGMRVDGCGMDMGFHIISSLSRTLYPNADRPDYCLRSEWM